MIYRGVYRDGVVTLTGHVDLPEGSVVEVLPATRATPTGPKARAVKPAKPKTKTRAKPIKKTPPKASARKPRMTKAERLAAALAAFGTWKDRPDFAGKSTIEIATELRRRAPRDGRF